MCGVVGVVSAEGNVIEEAIQFLKAGNNRGEQACGGAVFDGKKLRCYRGEGVVDEVFGKRDLNRWSKLVGSACIMHTLYSTIGRGGEKKQPQMFQPIVFNFHGKRGAIAHNGNLVRLDYLRRQAKKSGYKFNSNTSDTEVIAALLSTSKEKDFLLALVGVLKKIDGKGAFSLVILFRDKVIGIRDRNGIRPLCFGKRNNGSADSYILASESSVFPVLKSARFVREVEPGEVLVLGGEGIEKSFKWTDATKCAECPHRFCICEMIYFSNPAAQYFGRSVYAFRAKTGEISARNHPVNADVIVPVPDSGRHAADGFAMQSKIPKLEGLVKSRYFGRTFMEARENDRSQKQRLKLQALPDVMAGKSVCLIEDSIFRGSVSRPAISLSRIHGKAREVHLRVCAPPAAHTCHMGMDTATKQELLASHMTVAEIRDEAIHADSLEYLTMDELREAVASIGLNPNNFCFGCFVGEYPVDPPKRK